MAARKPTILVVEDDAELLEIVAMILSEAGYATLRAGDGASALELARIHRPDAIMLDMMLPDVDGLEFLDRLSRGPGLYAPPVLACSGFGAFESLAIARGARAFLKKPYEVEHLLEALRALLARAPVDQRTLEANVAAAARAQEAARARREDLLASNEISEQVRADARNVATWAKGYFGAERAYVTLLHGGRLHIVACAGKGAACEGSVHDPAEFFCPEVISARTNMVIDRVHEHPAFGHYRAAARSWLYAAAPLITREGVALGTLCIEDQRQLDFHGEDLALLSHCASSLGHRIIQTPNALVESDPMFVVPDVLGRSMSDVLIGAALRRAERDGTAIELTIMKPREEPSPELLRELAAEILERSGRRHVVLFEERGALGLLLAAQTASLVQQRTDTLIASSALRERLTASGAAYCAGAQTRAISATELHRAARLALSRSSGGQLERAELAPFDEARS